MNIRLSPKFIVFSILLVALPTACSQLNQPYDIIITSGKIFDGTGNPWYYADLGIRKGKIAKIGNLGNERARQVIDAEGLAVAPGFIDMHTHTERGMQSIPSVQNYIRQGVTTVVGGNCGGSPQSIGKFFKELEEVKVSLNVALLVGHNTIRREVMGTENRLATPDDLRQMKALAAKAMEEGAFGISTGLKYIPGAYANTAEVIALAQVVSSYGGFYASHMREEGLGLLEATQEAIAIGVQAHIPVQISHHKIVGQTMWGKSVNTLALVDQAAAGGLDITLDQYPYTATSTGLTIIFPAWSLEGGREKLNERLDAAESRAKIKRGIEDNIRYDRGGGDPANIVLASYATDHSLDGKNIAEITEMRGRAPTIANGAETIMDLVYASRSQVIYHCLIEDDVKRIMQHPRVMHASDGSTRTFGEGLPHPRNYGTYARVLGHYVREEQLLSLEEAIRKMTSLPAQRLNLQNRGLLKEGMWADVTLFDPQLISDVATWTEPHQYPLGIPYVIVNGVPVVSMGAWTEAFPGKALHGPGKK